jgi:hypothetical protein
MFIALSFIAAPAIPGTLCAQSLLTVPDSAMTTKSTAKNGLNLSGMSYGTSYSGIGATNSYNNFLKGVGSYKLNLSNGLSLKTESLSATNFLNPNNLMNPGNLRRENILPHEEILYGQHLTLGASYNGLNNMLKGGFGGANGRNPGLSLHAGISF